MQKENEPNERRKDRVLYRRWLHRQLGAGVLSRILEKLPRGEQDPNLLVGYDSKDDAAVYRITE